MFSLYHEAPTAYVEPAGLPSKKLARTHDVHKPSAAEPEGEDSASRARPEERTAGGKSAGSRSRSADPHLGGRTASKISAMLQNFPPGSKEKKAAEEEGSIPKISEYRSQFAWPRLARPKPVLATVFSPVHQAAENDAVDGIAEDVPLLAEVNESGDEINNIIKKTEYKSKFRPFNSYIYIDGNWKKPSKENKVEIEATNPWYSEVVERLKKADEYRWRSHGGHPLCGEQLPLIFSKPPDGWNQTRERSNLSELLIAQQQHQQARREEKPPPPKEKSRRTPSAAPLSRRREHEGGSAAEKKKTPETKPPRPKSADPTLGTSSSSRKSPKPPKSHHYTPRSKHPVAVINSTDMRPHVAFKPVKPSTESPRGSSRHPEGSKVWLKPQHKTAPASTDDKQRVSQPDQLPLVNGTAEPGDSTATEEDDDKKDVSRPTTLPSVNGVDAKSPPPPPPAEESSEKELAEIPSGPVPLTTVRSPEEVTGVKSPDPETWTVPLETGKGLEWTDGQTPDASRATSPPVLPPPPPAQPRTELPVGATSSFVPSVPKPAIPPPPPSAKPPELPPVDVISSRSLASDVLDRARSRLDQFWSKNK